MYYLNYKMLKKHNACRKALDQWRDLFGERTNVEITPEFVAKLRQKAPYLYHNVEWPAQVLLRRLAGLNHVVDRDELWRIFNRLIQLYVNKSDEEVSALLNRVGRMWARVKADAKTYTEWTEEGRVVNHGEQSVGFNADGEHVFRKEQTSKNASLYGLVGERGVTYAGY